ncbi:hypothetical protein CkaCkLH20_02656 [Colletotrichum karsti]|uniref:Uncharacterized protein n=1 Tax=Colletotrichum karsti TaxID=1095194 RepID=A0A9P6IBZ6_9PEZI|nr:uncharacterized protein CkaCkLH20_02656 [Colletotrichum karsti]KAF9879845.1 hypothetical protein CkaCkLH20_02656 [Colletotrichum karsti]
MSPHPVIGTIDVSPGRDNFRMASSHQPSRFTDRWAFLALTWEILGNSYAMKGLLTKEDLDLMEACRIDFNWCRPLTWKGSRSTSASIIEASYSRSTLKIWNSLAAGEKYDQEQLKIAIKEWRASAVITVPELPEARALLENNGSSPQDVSKGKRPAGSENANERSEKRARIGVQENASEDGTHKQPSVQIKGIRTLITPQIMASIEPSAVSIAEDRTKNLGFVSIQTVASIEPSEYPEPEVRPTGQSMAPESQSSDEPAAIERNLDTSEQNAQIPAQNAEADLKGGLEGIWKQKSMRADTKKMKKIVKKLAKLEKTVGKLKG